MDKYKEPFFASYNYYEESTCFFIAAGFGSR